MVSENLAAEFLRNQAAKARFFAERLGRDDAERLGAYAAECESRLAALVAASMHEPALSRAA